MWRKISVILFLGAVLALWLDLWNSANAQLPGNLAVGAGDPETEMILVSPNPTEYDRFGYPGKMQGERVFVAAAREDSTAQYAGAVRLFARNQGVPGSWGVVATFDPPTLQAGSNFGSWVDLDGDQFIVGAEGENAAYVFAEDPLVPGGWKQQARLEPEILVNNMKFGHHVALAGDVAVVGAPSYSADGVYGVAYVHERDAGSGLWAETAKLTGAGSQVGLSVATDGELILLGTPGYDVGGVDQAGGVLVWARDANAPTGWTPTGALTAPNPQEYAGFGRYFAMRGPWVAVIERWRERTGGGRGVAYLFRRNGADPGEWPLIATLVPEDTNYFNALGLSISVSPQGDRVAAGGQISNDDGSLPSTVYVFDRGTGGMGIWEQVLALTAEDDSHTFGYSVDIDASGVIAIGDQSGGEPAGRLHLLCINDDLEPNDDFASATPVESNLLTGLQLCGGGDLDTFALAVESGQDILAHIHFAHEAGDLNLALYSPDEVLLAESKTGTDDEIIVFDVDVPGVYYLVVEGAALAANRYELTTQLLELHFNKHPIAIRAAAE